MRVRVVVVGLVAVGLACLVGAKPLRASETRRVLVISSHQRGVPWTYKLTSAVETSLLSAKTPTSVEVHIMHTRPGSPGDPPNQVREAEYAREIGALEADVIVGVGEGAFAYITRYRTRFFSNTPVIFSGIGNTTARQARRQPEAAVIASDSNLRRNIEIMLRLKPGIRRVVLVHDQTGEGRAMAADARELKAGFAKLDVEFLTDMNMSELLGRIRRLPADSVLVPLAFTVEKSGRSYSPDEAVRMMAKALEGAGRGAVGFRTARWGDRRAGAG